MKKIWNPKYVFLKKSLWSYITNFSIKLSFRFLDFVIFLKTITACHSYHSISKSWSFLLEPFPVCFVPGNTIALLHYLFICLFIYLFIYFIYFAIYLHWQSYLSVFLNFMEAISWYIYFYTLLSKIFIHWLLVLSSGALKSLLT